MYYCLQGSNIPLAPSKTITNQTIDTTITENTINLAGYTAIPPTTITAILNATDNTITFYYTANSSGEPTPIPTSSTSPTHSSSTLPISSPASSPSAPPTEDSKDEKDTPVWALVNLVLSVVGVILTIMLSICVLLRRNQKQKKQQKDENDGNTMEEQKQKQCNLLWFALSVIMGIVGIIVFVLTEDMTQPMVLLDKMTIVNVVIFVIELIAIALTFKHKNDKDETGAYTVH